MSARLLDGKSVAARIRGEVRERAARVQERGVTPGLAVILVGGDRASHVHLAAKHSAAVEAGVAFFDRRLPEATGQAELIGLVRALGEDPRVHGILVQLPLPAHIDLAAVADELPPAKDADGFHPDNLGRLAQGRPRLVGAAPRGCMLLLEEAGAALRGARAAVVGRSSTVAQPVALLLINAGATVSVCHAETRDLAGEIARADVVVAAIGRAGFVRGEWIRPGAVVIDVGLHRGAGGRLCGDVDFGAAVERAAAITPVPGGVGPMTIACLLENAVSAAGG